MLSSAFNVNLRSPVPTPHKVHPIAPSPRPFPPSHLPPMASFSAEAHAATPPVPPPKPGSHDTSRISTPAAGAGGFPVADPERHRGPGGPAASIASTLPAAAPIPDPGDQWLPEILRDKSKQDLAEILASPELLNALTQSPSTVHPSLQASHQTLQGALADNISLAQQVVEIEARLARERATTQAQLLATQALERQWRQRQSDMDHALAPFSPASLYQQLNQGVQEQALVCQAMEESFLDASSGANEAAGAAVSERDVTDWIRKYREARVAYYLRHERKQRWDEGRVGGWR
ncbi:hypothetical protein HJFPF1_01433 [Paramyrothecium foliicola]|nr:hypothetical protein HJFPF1_01433 [Paramyrothecium foliicola]